MPQGVLLLVPVTEGTSDQFMNGQLEVKMFLAQQRKSY
jgi:hypothetical protein